MVSLLTFWNDITSSDKEKGATATEYALLIGLIAVAIILAVTALGGGISTLFQNIADRINAIVVP
ncbi:Flp family type IVb pilin [Sinomonas sp. JC656]|uniref:Flp family type IVb pilin n=2 Tax=Sinomonas cellulolyticus TaxID=2801916 RepID=A0ABS1K177_9MICC|nr:Flp family type IVb pilin [Sinomonas cellulolyticus]